MRRWPRCPPPRDLRCSRHPDAAAAAPAWPGQARGRPGRMNGGGRPPHHRPRQAARGGAGSDDARDAVLATARDRRGRIARWRRDGIGRPMAPALAIADAGNPSQGLAEARRARLPIGCCAGPPAW
ncbi:hypothetical protein CKO45_00920 [Paracraurococcus ruber]|uniref:Uncharacterized protein n=1 Tax=Paracraurococcus ruber TaxID=77675 RepID=A0ABS1CQR7_9PROT|nr:hypothetical protein [Paracraurococcus ruber]